MDLYIILVAGILLSWTVVSLARAEGWRLRAIVLFFVVMFGVPLGLYVAAFYEAAPIWVLVYVSNILTLGFLVVLFALAKSVSNKVIRYG